MVNYKLKKEVKGRMDGLVHIDEKRKFQESLMKIRLGFSIEGFDKEDSILYLQELVAETEKDFYEKVSINDKFDTCNYSFEITNDIIEKGSRNRCFFGQHAIGELGSRCAKSEIFKKFRMKDDDGEIYYEGILYLKDESLLGSEIEFVPLDEFGMLNAGCTSIEYWEEGKWVAL